MESPLSDTPVLNFYKQYLGQPSVHASHWDNLEAAIRRRTADIDLSFLRKAYDWAEIAHAETYHQPGEPYISHPAGVAMILAETLNDEEVLVAALLHDVPSANYRIPSEEISAVFGNRVATLVDGVTQINRFNWSLREFDNSSESRREVDNLRKLFLAMVNDVRPVLIALADRLDTMRNMQRLQRPDQFHNAEETMLVYAPMAERLGITSFKAELEDLAMRYLDPYSYFTVLNEFERREVNYKHYLSNLIEQLNIRLHDVGIIAETTGREKHITSIIRKMQRGELSLDRIFDVLGLRVITDNNADCYGALGIVHANWLPILSEFDDYIVAPKNGIYQSIHTTVIGPGGHAVEIQIRTREMHYINEFGIAAHWRYKEGSPPSSSVEAKVRWMRQLLEWEEKVVVGSPLTRGSESLSNDRFNETIHVFTPTRRFRRTSYWFHSCRFRVLD